MDDSKIEHTRFRKGAIPLDQALPVAEEYRERMLEIASAALIVGSVLRRKEIVGDIDILILPKNVARAMMALEAQGFRGDSRIQRKMVNNILVEIYLAHSRKEMGGLQVYLTGDIEFVREMRDVARDQGWDLTPYGLFERGINKPVLQSPDERDLFDALGVPWTPPEARTTREGVSPSLGDRYIPPKEWSPFWKKMTQPSKKPLFPNISWDLGPWRAPDFQDEGKMVWYGSGGRQGTEGAVILYQDGGWSFGQFTHTQGLIANAPSAILSVWTFVSYDELARAVLEKSMVEIPIDAFERAPDAWAGFAAAIGAVKVGYYGGKEEFVDRLP